MVANIENLSWSGRSSGGWLRARVVPAACKLLLCLGGLGFLGETSGTLSAPILLSCCAVLGFLAIQLVARISSLSLRRLIGRAVVPCGFAFLVVLNVIGWIGTLTGSEHATSLKNLSLVAAPFYVLSICAVISDVATKRLKIPAAIDYFTYIALPFKLLAGPLEPPSFIRQLARWQPRFSLIHLSAAWPWVALGAMMKFTVGNHLTAAVFELKFYFDFAGYSFIGYGGALALGLRMNRNFANPFFAPNVVLFWRRWHMSLGRFLSRYLLEPNVGKIPGRFSRMIFTSAIFLVSAMWHGGTGNYAMWGLFHGCCYFLWISRLKHWHFPRPIGIATMLCFFVMGRFLAIEARWSRLVEKLSNLISPQAWADDLHHLSDRFWPLLQSQMLALTLAALVLTVEGLSIRQYGWARSYHAFRRPYAALAVLVFCLFFAVEKGGLLYARL